MKILPTIKEPSDIKKLNILEMKKLANEIRRYLIDVTSETGGHLSSNLGVVELTLALHKCFDSPEDKLIWDVGHQAYVHKILTGRCDQMATIRQWKGLSGFPKRSESIHDCFDTGHSSTSISAGIGMAAARDLNGGEQYIVPIIGDGALTGGMAYEALNNGANIKKNFIIILNDNQMSIDRNVGGLALYLDRFRTGEFYNDFKNDIEITLRKIPKVGNSIVKGVRGVKNGVKQLVVPGMLFEELGYTYLGPIDGHDLRQLITSIEQAKHVKGPVIIHTLTLKGKGYNPAEKDPMTYHGVKPFDKTNGDFHKGVEVLKPSYSEIVGKTLTHLADNNKKIVAITAAMCSGTGLSKFSKQYPQRFFDVGIAEQHAVTFSAGLAVQGYKPFFVVYSSFLQRAYDQVIHDVAIQKLPVVFCIDRAGLVGEDGETHQGLFDLSYLSHIPNMTVMAPKSGQELEAMLEFAADYNEGPIAIRYPKGKDEVQSIDAPITYGQPEWLVQEDNKILLLSVGHFYSRVTQVHARLKEEGYTCDLVNLRFVNPIDPVFIQTISQRYERVYVFEENVKYGGVQSRIAQMLLEEDSSNIAIPRVYGIGIENQFVPHGKISDLNRALHIDVEGLTNRVLTIERAKNNGK